MSMREKLMKKSIEELREMLDKNIEEAKEKGLLLNYHHGKIETETETNKNSLNQKGE